MLTQSKGFNDRVNLVVTNSIQLHDEITDEKLGKGRKFVSRFIEPGMVYYKEFGDVLITKETLDKFIDTMVGCPVIINHKDITNDNVDDERVGVVSRVWYNSNDNFFYCEGIIWDKEAIDLVKKKGWNVSCSYDFQSDFESKTHNGKKIDCTFTDGNFLHLALVDNPRYERANIVVNSKEQEFKTVGEGESKHVIPVEYMDKDKNKKSEEEQQEIDKEFRERIKKETEKYKEKKFNLGTSEKFNIEDLINKGFEPIELGGGSATSTGVSTVGYALYDEDNKNDLSNYYRMQKITKEEFKHAKDLQKLNTLKSYKKDANNSIERKENTVMTALNELEKFVRNIVENACKNEEKEEIKEEMKVENADKRKLIDEVAGMMKSAGCDDEIIRTAIAKMEKIGYEKSEAGSADNKCKNADEEEKEEKFEEEKEIAENEKDEEKDEEKIELEEEVENKCHKAKNSMDEENTMDKAKNMVYNGNSEVKSTYISRADRIELGNNY